MTKICFNNKLEKVKESPKLFLSFSYLSIQQTTPIVGNPEHEKKNL